MAAWPQAYRFFFFFFWKIAGSKQQFSTAFVFFKAYLFLSDAHDDGLESFFLPSVRPSVSIVVDRSLVLREASVWICRDRASRLVESMALRDATLVASCRPNFLATRRSHDGGTWLGRSRVVQRPTLENTSRFCSHLVLRYLF